MTTKTKTNKFLTALARAEETTAAEAAELRNRLTVARSEMDKYEAIYEQAEDDYAGVKDRLLGGDESVTVSDFGQADAALKRAELLNDAPANIVKRLERQQISTNTEIAEAVAHVVAPTLPGVPVVTTFAKVDAPTDLSDLPVLVITQTEAPERSSSAHLKGRAHLTLYRTDVQREMNASTMKDKMRDSRNIGVGNIGSISTRDVGDGMFADTAIVSVQAAHSPVPVITVDPGAEQAEQVASLVNSRLAPLSLTPHKVVREIKLGRWGSPSAVGGSMNGSVETDSARVTSSKVGNDGVRKTVVEVTSRMVVGIGADGAGVDGGNCKAVLRDLPDTFEKSVGTVSEAELVSDNSEGTGRLIKSRVTLLSKPA